MELTKFGVTKLKELLNYWLCNTEEIRTSSIRTKLVRTKITAPASNVRSLKGSLPDVGSRKFFDWRQFFFLRIEPDRRSNLELNWPELNGMTRSFFSKIFFPDDIETKKWVLEIYPRKMSGWSFLCGCWGKAQDWWSEGRGFIPCKFCSFGNIVIISTEVFKETGFHINGCSAVKLELDSKKVQFL